MRTPAITVELEVVVPSYDELQFGVDAGHHIQGFAERSVAADFSEVAAVEEDVGFWEGKAEGVCVCVLLVHL